MISNKCISDIKEALKAYEQPNLFANSEESLIEACVDLLKYVGYSVNRPVNYKNNARKLEDIPAHFYTRLKALNSGSEIQVYQNFGRDMALAKGMVNNRMQTTGVNREIAIKECYAIIDAFFDNIKEFNLRGPVRFELFGQKNMAWVTDKTIQIMKRNIRHKEERAFDEHLDKISKQAEEEDDFSYDLDSILKKIKEEG